MKLNWLFDLVDIPAHETALDACPAAVGAMSKRQPTDGSKIFCSIRLTQP